MRSLEFPAYMGGAFIRGTKVQLEAKHTSAVMKITWNYYEC